LFFNQESRWPILKPLTKGRFFVDYWLALLYYKNMKMEDLNKTQIVLLTLLVSFVTSIATGIVTVTLLEQAPPAVTQTINRVVEKTIQTVIPGEKQVTTVVKEVIVKEENLLVNAVEKTSKSLVQISAVDEDGINVFLGLGVVISGDGYIITDKDRIIGNRNNLVASRDGNYIDIEIVSENEDIIILKTIKPEIVQENKSNNKDIQPVAEEQATENFGISLIPATLADSDSVKLGQSIATIGGKSGDSVFMGIVSRLDTEIVVESDGEDKKEGSNEVKILKYIVTNLELSNKNTGSPLLNMDGDILGVNIVAIDGTILSVPSNKIKKLLFEITNIVSDDMEDGDLTKSE